MKRSGENMRTLATAYMHFSIFIVQSVSKPAIASREQGKFHGEYLQPTHATLDNLFRQPVDS